MFIIYFLDCDKLNHEEKIQNLINIGNIHLSEDEWKTVCNITSILKQTVLGYTKIIV